MKALKSEAVPAYTGAEAQPKSQLRGLAETVAAAGKWVLITLLFGMAYTQSVLYDGNQNTKFLHGLAQAGVGFLHEDWLALTADPLPVFTFLVSTTVQFLHPNFFYLYYIAIFGVYIYSLIGIGSILFDLNRSRAKFITYAALLIFIHSMWLQVFVQQRVNFSFEILHFGVAGQYILGQEFQNSVFGVFLLLSMFLFLKQRYFWAFFWLGFTSILHSAYLFHAGLLTATYAAILFFEAFKPAGANLKAIEWQPLIRAATRPVLYGLLTLLMVAPVLWYSATALAGSSPEASSQSMEILVHYRIPHHSLPASWFNRDVYIQVGLMLAGMIVARKSRLFWLMLVTFLAGLALTIVQIITGSDSLGMLAPWRVSILLVPLSTALLAAFAVSLVFHFLRGPAAKLQPVVAVVALAVVLFVAYRGASIQQDRFERFSKRAVVRVLNFARNNRAAGQIYLVPPRDNKFDDFRLYTGVPIFINWKSHPYRDFEVLEWYNRIQEAEAFYNAPPAEACQILAGLEQEYKITHVAFKFDRQPPQCEQMAEIYHDARYTVYEIGP